MEMKYTIKIFYCVVFVILFLTVKNSNSQDLSAFEIIENQSIGLTAAPYAKTGLCLVDIDNNGWADIYTPKYNGGGYSHIYLNNEGIFTEISDQSPLEQIEDVAGIRTFTVVWADYDNDGDKDCSFGTNENLHLLRNDDGVFTDVAQEMGFIGQVPPGFILTWYYNVGGWADYDLDGDLDCVVFQQNNPNLYLFRNDGEHFTNVASEAGLDSTKLSDDPFVNHVSWTDFDLDGDQDLIGKDEFYENRDGVFVDVSDAMGFELDIVDNREFFDYDNDGDLDFFKTTVSPEEAAVNELWENRDGVFVNVTEDVGMGLMRDRYRGLCIGDFDNDGDQDIFIQINIFQVPDVLLLNEEIEPGVRAFADVAEFVGITKTGDRKGGGFFDYDNDGFLDIYSPSAEFNHLLYHNLAVNEANWIGFRLEGTYSNRDAIGSIIKLYYAGKQQLRFTRAGHGWVRQDNPWIHFGLGFETSVDSVVIHWPLGLKQVITDIAINQYHNVKEVDWGDEVQSRDETPKPTSFKLGQNYPNPFNPSTNIEFELSKESDVTLAIYNVAGKEIAKLINSQKQAGYYCIRWDGRDDSGRLMPSGVYLYRLKAKDFTATKKMVFVQ